MQIFSLNSAAYIQLTNYYYKLLLLHKTLDILYAILRNKSSTNIENYHWCIGRMFMHQHFEMFSNKVTVTLIKYYKEEISRSKT